MRLTQAAVVAILAFTVAATPIQARQQDVKAVDEYKTPDSYVPKCYDHEGKEKPCEKEPEKQPGKSASTVETMS